MNSDEINAVFDQMAAGYDKQWARTAPITKALYFLLESVFAGLPDDARILCVGVGTGNELIHLAKRFPGWRFTAVEPSSAMLAVCRRRCEEADIADRCDFHQGYLDSLAGETLHDGATCFLVSQFILDKDDRSALFRGIAARLKPGGVLASADLSAQRDSQQNYESLLRVWQRVTAPAQAGEEGLQRMKAAYAKDVAVLPAAEIVAILQAGGFEAPVPFFQAGLIRAWFSKRAAGDAT
ncbi:class I SAM-dependent methyltransferase [Alloalcanivorax mobilis]|uniref:class I SAM-dependent methyltransferase n=1 Tax=Alloalcanivorax mobilis TaxID=2019569 RepID=UPI000B5B47A4|nr:class I SAM-dependent methyltransferase [Alloalcanivorax mobilis]ASK33291.1 SAM-dependent methyltransferase [Alcanivorax sp. N3-2A]|tara:strand:- start:125304 stop:126017 length:714 start_codon:yes stop_codon:yes gene_type:complete